MNSAGRRVGRRRRRRMGRQGAAHGQGGGAKGHLGARRHSVAGHAQPGQEGHVGDPGDGADGPAEPSDGDVEESPDDGRVELAPGATGQLLAGGDGAHGLLVGAGRSHDLEGVGHRDDAGPERELLPRQTERVPRAVVALVVLLDREAPWTEPGGQRGNEAAPLQRMSADLLPFVLTELALFVEDVRVHGQLADVVEQRRPAQPVPVGLREVELVGDHVGEGPDPFGVAPRPAVVPAERGRQRQDLLGHRRGHRGAGAGGTDLGLGSALQVPGQARPPGHLQALGGPVGEEHGHLQQCGQGQERAGTAVRPRRR